MFDYQLLYQTLSEQGAEQWATRLPGQIDQAFTADGHGDLPRWLDAIEQLPNPPYSKCRLDADEVQIGSADDLSKEEQNRLKAGLEQLHPWRKGPYDLFGIHIDTEWRSDWKWNRLQSFISPLHNRLVLDVGCGNGYHCWRMLGCGAKIVVGVDPTLLSVMQFQAVSKLYGESSVYVLPLGIEDVPNAMRAFDTVFSMGVLYHRRSPIDHLMELRDTLRPGGEMVLETLVIEGRLGEVLVPEGRYAKMRNVWFIPSCDTLISWVKRCGFKEIRLVDVTKTSIEEQRSTEWMRFQSLQDFLDSDNNALTIEGLPAPVRATLIARVN